MQRKHLIWIALAVVGYIAWRKFGDSIKSSISSVTSK